MRIHLNQILRAACSSAALSVLVACGGGGGAGVTATPTASVAGTAATGAAIASGTVTLKCVSGTSTAATTGTDGSFSIDVSSVTLPCVGRVDYKDASGAPQKLHTFISAAGTANITPVTELLVASLTSGTAADAFDKFDGTKAKAFTAAQIKAAADAVKTYLKNTLGVDTTNLPDDPVGTKFVATAGSTAGDKADKVLDDLAAKLKAGGKKLGDAVGDISKGGSGGSGGGGGSGTGTLVVSSATNSARNGSYTPSVTKQAQGADTDYNGQTKDGLFEYDIVQSATGGIKSASIWFFNGSGSSQTITYFGCGGTAVPCPTTVGYEPILKQILFSKAPLSQITDPFASGGPTLVNSGEKITVDGSLSTVVAK